MKRNFLFALLFGVTAVVSVLLRAEPVLSQSGTKLPSTITVASSPNPSTLNETVTLTAIVRAVRPDDGIPTGTVEFFLGPDSLGTTPLLSGAMDATASISVNLPAGLHPIHTTYSGDSTFLGGISGPPIPQEVSVN